MITIKEMIEFEAEVAEAFNASKIRAPVHLSGGNELEVHEIFCRVREQDWVATTWRSHLHCLCKGVPKHRLMEDILAGKSITLNYPDYRIISSAIVGGAVPIAVGIAMGIKRDGKDEKVYCFVGDMAARSGIFHECRQYAEGHDLPIRFVIEDNGISVCTPTDAAWGTGKVVHDESFASWENGATLTYKYKLGWPHAGTGKRVEF